MNLGVNAGVAAGQTIAHAHLHLIPRYEKNVPDPAGGIRWMFPDRARYEGAYSWKAGTTDPLLTLTLTDRPGRLSWWIICGSSQSERQCSNT
jgi:hypothetical protein